MGRIKTHVDKRSTVDLLKKFVSINSVNPSLVEGAPGEAEIAEFIAEYLRAIGIETILETVEPGRLNVVGILRGVGSGPTLMLNGHLDTVGIDYMEIEPLNPVVKDGRLYGRGSNDMKGGLAAILSAAEAIVKSGIELQGDLVVAGVCDEEYASIGTRNLVKNLKVDAAIVGEPSGLQIRIAHKGFAWIDIETKGVAAHGSRPDIGVDAIAKMGKVLVEIEKLQDEVLNKKNHRLVGSPSIHASIIRGGRELSTYPDFCKLQVERRMIPGEKKSDIEAEMKSLLNDISVSDPKFEGKHFITLIRGPMEISPEEEICRILHRSTMDVTGKEPEFIGISGWMDTEIIWRHGTPSVAFGPRGSGSHSAIEYVELDSVIDTAKILEMTAVKFCGADT